MAITSDEVNYLVYRYLQESGFTHSAFTFGYESFAHKSPINVNDVPPGALISFVQKGLQYLELEANLNIEGTAVDGDFAALSAREMLTKDTDELKRTVADRRDRSERDRAVRDERGGDRAGFGAGGAAGGAAAGLAAAREPDGAPQEIPASQVTTLEGHSSEVFICAWSPNAPLLASGSGDSTARIWDLSGARGEGAQPRAVVLKHFNKANEKAKDVTTLDWNGDGSLLATGSYDGLARIWSRDGELRNTLCAHKGPIFSLKWNRKGSLLLSGSVDKTAIIWDGRTGEVKQQFEFHTAPTLDVDWRDNTSFATCSTDKLIYVCRLGLSEPQKSLQGHSDEVNAIKWDPQGKLLASCSDDHTAKIWAVDRDAPLVHDLTAHTKEIYTIKWSPTGPSTANPGQRLMLVSASFDTSIRLWDAETGQCIFALTRHTQPVYSVAFSPSGQLLASGSFDKSLHVWSVRDGSLVSTYKGAGGIFEVCWARDGEHVAACFSNKVVAVLDVRA
ncbi:hypothetical protein WJX81_003500 [Elliptochloris bilobata]|uniref:Uncharacterized protein n=1 Tax=Elliptochloris bilobata TaxID=381761 RepID=A0AAW1SEG8_9CHLO